METEFRKQLEKLINQNSLENGSNTPDFILAEYLENCLNAYNIANSKKTSWYGTLQDCKELFASNYNKTWKDVQNDFEYGLGLSKIYEFEQVMDMVAEIYCNQQNKNT